jgi:hypothetical protein
MLEAAVGMTFHGCVSVTVEPLKLSIRHHSTALRAKAQSQTGDSPRPVRPCATSSEGTHFDR